MHDNNTEYQSLPNCTVLTVFVCNLCHYVLLLSSLKLFMCLLKYVDF